MAATLDVTTLLAIALVTLSACLGRAYRSRWTGRLVALLLLSPGLRYLSTLFSFPIRLQLSAWAGDLLRLVGMDVETAGNVLIKNGQSGAPVEMAVDPACVGLQMTGVTLLVALFFLIWQEKQAQRSLPLSWILAYGLVVFGLTVVCNLFRIVLLVAFGAMPGTITHEIVGLVCLVLYAWLPAWGLAQWLVRRFGQPIVVAIQSGWSAAWGTGLLLAGIGIMAFAAKPAPVPPAIKFTDGNLVGYRYKTLPNGFVQLTKPGVLIYVKPQTDWFSADHSPMACWRGSGYEIRRVRETIVNGHPAYIGELQKTGRPTVGQRKSGTTLYTAWWFTNSTETTISQLAMRRQMLQHGRRFALINVTTANPKLLHQPLGNLALQ